MKAGEQIGRGGDAGSSFSFHLHYEAKVNGKYVNPQTFMEVVDITLPLLMTRYVLGDAGCPVRR